MDRSQLIEALAAHYEGNRKAAAKALDAVVDTITREVSRGEKVAITGFGAFEKAVRPAGRGRDQAAGEATQSAEEAVARFHPAADLKAVVAGVRSLPSRTLSTAVSAAAAVTGTAARATGLGGSVKPSHTSEPAPSAPPVTASFEPPAQREAADEAVTPTETTPAKKAPAKKAPAKKAAAKKAPAKKAPAKKATPRTAPSKKAAATAPAKAAGKAAPATKAATPRQEVAAESSTPLADPPLPDTSSEPVLSTGPAETTQPGQS